MEGGGKNVRNILIAAAGVASLLAAPALAREGAWMGIGVRPINTTTTSQTIEVSDINVPRETMFCTDDSQVQILTADFHYRNGRPKRGTARRHYRLPHPRDE